LTHDRIQDVVRRFYTKEEIMHAKGLLNKHHDRLNLNIRFRHASKKMSEQEAVIFEIKQLLKLVLTLDVKDNTGNVMFAATNLKRIPPNDNGQIDIIIMDRRLEEITK